MKTLVSTRARKSAWASVACALIAALVAVGGIASASDSAAPTARHDGAAAAAHWADAEHNAAVVVLQKTIVWNTTVAANEWYAAAFYADILALAENYRPPAPPAPPPAPPKAAAPKVITQAVMPKSTSAPAPVSNGGGASGACGGSTRDYVIPKESGGNPNARNASGAWGCYQIMPGTWQSSCSDLGQHGSASTSAQAQCANRLPPSAWAASQG